MVGIDKLTKYRREGFSMVEVIIVGIIASIMVMLTLVSFQGLYKSIKFENEVKNLVSFIRYAQVEAATERKNKSIVILPEEKRLILQNESKDFEFSNDYDIKSDMIKIIFKNGGELQLIDIEDPELAVKPSGWIEIEKISTGDRAKIELWAFSGYVKYKTMSFRK